MGSLSSERGGSPGSLTPKDCSIVLPPKLLVEPRGNAPRTRDFCSSVTFSGVRGCVCSPCVTAESSGSTGPPQGVQLLPEVGNVWELPLLLPPGLGFVGWLPVAEKHAWSPSRRDEPFPNPWSDGHAGPAAKELVGRRFYCTFGEVLGYQGQISVPG